MTEKVEKTKFSGENVNSKSFDEVARQLVWFIISNSFLLLYIKYNISNIINFKMVQQKKYTYQENDFLTDQNFAIEWLYFACNFLTIFLMYFYSKTF